MNCDESQAILYKTDGRDGACVLGDWEEGTISIIDKRPLNKVCLFFGGEGVRREAFG